MLFLLACSDYKITPEAVDPEDTSVFDTGSPPEDTGLRDTAPIDTAPAGTVVEGDDTGVVTEPAPGRIVVYSTEGRRDRDNYLGFFDGLATDPLLADWEVVVLERAVDGPLTAAQLDGATQLWVFGTDRDDGSELTSGEIRTVSAFVDAGNGLLLAAEHSDSAYSYVEDVNGIAELYGVSFEGSLREGDDGALQAPESPGFLCAGVGQVPVFASVGRIDVRDSAVELAFSIDGYPAMVLRDDDVRVVFDRSWGGWRDWFRGYGDQGMLVQNVARFLEG